MRANGATIRWQVSPAELAQRVEDWGENFLEAIFRLAQVFAARIETYAKKNAPWKDITTNARQGLFTRAFKTATGFIIYLCHKMEYGIWLEVANAGKYAIILKTLERHYSPLMKLIRDLLGVRR